MSDSKLHWILSYIFISAFPSLVDISKGIMSSTIGLNIYTIIAETKKYKSIIKKKNKKHDEIIALLGKTSLDCIEGSTSSSVANFNCFLLINMLREYDNTKKKLINLKLHKLVKNFNVLIKQCHHTGWSVEKYRK